MVYSKQMTCDRYATEPDDNLLTGWFEQVFFEKKDESVGWKRSDPPITEFYRVLPGFTGFYGVLRGFTGFYWVLLSFTGFYRVLRGSTGFYRV